MIKLIVRGIGFALTLSLIAGAARAELVKDMYEAEVVVADQSAAELGRAAGQGLSDVLVKVSGTTEVLSNPTITKALGDARNRVESYSYHKGPGVPPQTSVKLSFEGAYVTGLVVGAGVPIWTANRPIVLVWLVVEDAAGRVFPNAATAPALMAAVQSEFARRGVPIQLPAHDAADAAALTPEQAWNLDDPALVPASARYQLRDILVGRVSLLEGGAAAGEWSFLQGDNPVRRTSNVASEGLFVRDGAALVAETLAARYAAVASSSGGIVTLAVSGLTSYADYSAVVKWLEGLELVERADVAAVRGDTVTLNLKAKAGAAQLASIIELNKRLVPVPAVGPGLARPGLDGPGLADPGLNPGTAGPVPPVDSGLAGPGLSDPGIPGPVPAVGSALAGPGPELNYQWQK